MKPTDRFAGSSLLLALVLSAPALAPSAASAQAVLPPGFTDEPIAGGLRYSPSMAFLPDLRLLVVEKYDARVRLVVNGALLAAPVAVIDSVRQSSEAGLLGIAVDPAWPAKPYVYVHYNYLGSRSIRIARYTAVGDVAFTGSGAFTLDLASRHIILADLPDQFDQHNGGGVRFGADGMLYVSLGDDLFQCNAVMKHLLQGKIVRLDVSNLPAGPGGPASYASITPVDNPFVGDPNPGARLVYAYGLRNPFSFHVDLPTGDLVIADVGTSTYEEVDLQTAPGQNFGWPSYEGPIATGSTCPNQDSLTAVPPIYAYDRTTFLHGAAVIASPRYRRPASGANRFPAAYEGDIFVSDVGEGFLRRAHWNGTNWGVADSVPGQPTAGEWGLNMDGVTDYLLHPDGSLWYLKYAEFYNNLTGEVRRIRYDNSTGVPQPAGTTRVSFAGPHPSPASHAATLAFTTAEAGRARLVIPDIAGREVRRVLDEASLPAARHEREWDLRDETGRIVAPGLYVAAFDAGGVRLARRLIVVR